MEEKRMSKQRYVAPAMVVRTCAVENGYAVSGEPIVRQNETLVDGGSISSGDFI